MRVLLTGASSFSGFWFVKELVAAGHDVAMTFRHRQHQYQGVRGERVNRLRHLGRQIWDCSFGDTRFLELVAQESAWDLFCHHAAATENYKSPDFQVIDAVAGNVRNLRQVISVLSRKGCHRVILTGSFFENGEGAGSQGLPSFSPYGLSKSLTSDVFQFYCAEAGVRLGKFVIPNPFGPYEEHRFTSYLVRSWFDGNVATVRRPAYVRDNIHVSLLAWVYRGFAEQLSDGAGFEQINPSGYIETQGAFAHRVASEMQKRLPVACHLKIETQTSFCDPRIRINTDPADAISPGWNESAAWDELADYYNQRFKHLSAPSGDR